MSSLSSMNRWVPKIEFNFSFIVMSSLLPLNSEHSEFGNL